ncbi:MAG: histidine phosphatase family protein [Veillonellaceae bacterium]|nr:histidine phosphatase family protein [Veillonellaceae bacterium]
MVRIILVRHGETKWNIEGRYQGQEDTELSQRGLEQAAALAKGLRDVSIDVCLSSPLQRSYITAKACADVHGLPVQKDECLTEINHGVWEGQLAKDIEAQYPDLFHKWHTKPGGLQMPGSGGESLEDVQQRARKAFEEYAKHYEGKTLLVVAHDAVNKAIICDLLGLSMDHFWQIKQDNTCINVLEKEGDTWRVVLLNSTAHMGYLFSGIEQAGL